MTIVGISLAEYRKHKEKKKQGKSISIFVFGSFMQVSCYLLTLVHELDSSTYISELALTVRCFL